MQEAVSSYYCNRQKERQTDIGGYTIQCAATRLVRNVINCIVK